jgi:hypothetical protein
MVVVVVVVVHCGSGGSSIFSFPEEITSLNTDIAYITFVECSHRVAHPASCAMGNRSLA